MCAVPRSVCWLKIKIVIAKNGRDLADDHCVRLARVTETFTGAEIEQAYIDALNLTLDDGGGEPQGAHSWYRPHGN